MPKQFLIIIFLSALSAACSCGKSISKMYSNECYHLIWNDEFSMGSDNNAEWYSNALNTDSLGGTIWANQFHGWRMDWTKDDIG